jgi:hypothetical protein
MNSLRPSLLLVLLLVLAVTQGNAQRSVFKGKKLPPQRSNYNAIRIPKSKSFVCPVFDESSYPYTGIGVKVGDPFALTFKFYISKNFAVVADFGKSASALYSQYYTDIFDNYFPDPDDTLTYFSHKVVQDWVGEFKLIYQIDASALSPGLWFYTGAGVEGRDLKIDYQYSTNAPLPPETRTVQRKRTTQGVEAVIGVEYANFKFPISTFLELEYYYDLAKDPGWTKLQGGVGLRYIF